MSPEELMGWTGSWFERNLLDLGEYHLCRHTEFLELELHIWQGSQRKFCRDELEVEDLG